MFIFIYNPTVFIFVCFPIQLHFIYRLFFNYINFIIKLASTIYHYIGIKSQTYPQKRWESGTSVTALSLSCRHKISVRLCEVLKFWQFILAVLDYVLDNLDKMVWSRCCDADHLLQVVYLWWGEVLIFRHRAAPPYLTAQPLYCPSLY